MWAFKKNIYKTSREDTTIPVFTNDFCCSWAADDTIHVPPGGSVTYIDEFGVTQTVSGLYVGNPATITYRSIVSVSGPTGLCGSSL